MNLKRNGEKSGNQENGILEVQQGRWRSPQLLRMAHIGGFTGGAVVENLPANAGDTGSSPGLGRSHMLRNN